MAPGAKTPWNLASCLGFAIALSATALPDEPSDRESRKLTLATRVGGERAAWCIVALNALTLALVPFGLEAVGLRVDPWLLLPALAALGVVLTRPAPPGSRRMVVRVAAAITATVAMVSLPLVGLALR